MSTLELHGIGKSYNAIRVLEHIGWRWIVAWPPCGRTNCPADSNSGSHWRAPCRSNRG